MKTINLHQIDAFTDKIFGGNPAGVVTNADGLTDEDMGKIAREMNLSETAFVLRPTSDAADVKLRYITCGGVELDFCGHATIAAIYELVRSNTYGLDGPGTRSIRVENGAGILNMSVLPGQNNRIKVQFLAPAVKMQRYHLQGEAFARSFGLPANSLRLDSLILIDSVLNYLYIPISSLSQLGGLAFDSAKLAKNFKTDKIVAFSLYSAETLNPSADLHVRVTCPLLGIAEDPCTGSIQAGLVQAAKKNGVLSPTKTLITTEQGHFLNRPSFVEVNHDIKLDLISVTATAAHVFSTTIDLAS